MQQSEKSKHSPLPLWLPSRRSRFPSRFRIRYAPPSSGPRSSPNPTTLLSVLVHHKTCDCHPEGNSCSCSRSGRQQEGIEPSFSPCSRCVGSPSP